MTVKACTELDADLGDVNVAQLNKYSIDELKQIASTKDRNIDLKGCKLHLDYVQAINNWKKARKGNAEGKKKKNITTKAEEKVPIKSNKSTFKADFTGASRSAAGAKVSKASSAAAAKKGGSSNKPRKPAASAPSLWWQLEGEAENAAFPALLRDNSGDYNTAREAGASETDLLLLRSNRSAAALWTHQRADQYYPVLPAKHLREKDADRNKVANAGPVRGEVWKKAAFGYNLVVQPSIHSQLKLPSAEGWIDTFKSDFFGNVIVETNEPTAFGYYRVDLAFPHTRGGTAMKSNLIAMHHAASAARLKHGSPLLNALTQGDSVTQALQCGVPAFLLEQFIYPYHPRLEPAVVKRFFTCKRKPADYKKLQAAIGGCLDGATHDRPVKTTWPLQKLFYELHPDKETVAMQQNFATARNRAGV